MNTRLRFAIVLGWLVFSFIRSFAQLSPQCSTCFTSEITKAVKSGDHCTDYEIKVSYVGRCEHALSHFTVAIPSCAELKNLSHNQQCSQAIGYDPTTGLTGFKVENGNNF